MFVRQFKIRNFKSLKEFDIEDVPDMVVLAGPNGVGKSSVLQAIAYLKEVIAPYPPYGLPPIVSRWQSKVVSTNIIIALPRF